MDDLHVSFYVILHIGLNFMMLNSCIDSVGTLVTSAANTTLGGVRNRSDITQPTSVGQEKGIVYFDPASIQDPTSVIIIYLAII